MKNPPIYDWLRSNLGSRCLSPLTGTDAKALVAAVAIIELYSLDRDSNVLDAFAVVVSKMQKTTWELAYHAIASVLEWEDRREVWGLAGLPAFEGVVVCAYEPGGKARRAA